MGTKLLGPSRFHLQGVLHNGPPVLFGLRCSVTSVVSGVQNGTSVT